MIAAIPKGPMRTNNHKLTKRNKSSTRNPAIEGIAQVQGRCHRPRENQDKKEPKKPRNRINKYDDDDDDVASKYIAQPLHAIVACSVRSKDRKKQKMTKKQHII